MAQHGAAAPSRSGGIDAARLVLAFMVVIAHGVPFMAISPEAHFLFNNALARLIVPFFLLITGFFFDRQISRGIGKLAWRILWVYVGWTVIYLPFIVFYQEVTAYRLALTLFFGYFHLWFLPALLGGVLLLYAVRNLSDGVLMALAAGVFCVGGTMQYSLNLWFDFSTVSNPYDLMALTRNFLFFGFPYLALGVLIARGRLLADTSPARRAIMLLVGVVIMLAEAAMGYRIIPEEGLYDLTFSAFFLTPVLFVIVRDLPLKLSGDGPRKLSMVIYFSHMLYLLPLRFYTDLGPVALTAATFAATFAFAPLWIRVGDRLKILP